MDELRKTHLSNLLSLFSQKNTKQKGEDVVQHALLIQLNCLKNSKVAEDSSKTINSMCTHCFTQWKEGKFSVKLKPKNRLKCSGRKNALKRMQVKCSICLHAEYITFRHENQIPTSRQKNTETSTERIFKFTHNVNKRNSISKVKAKKKSKNNTAVAKKSSLTLLGDLL